MFSVRRGRSTVPQISIAAVRLGDLVKFNATLDKYGPTAFHTDETITLIVRLRQNVIKTAVRQISTAYSRISVDDIRKKLQLQHGEEAEYIVAKVGFLTIVSVCFSRGCDFTLRAS